MYIHSKFGLNWHSFFWEEDCNIKNKIKVYGQFISENSKQFLVVPFNTYAIAKMTVKVTNLSVDQSELLHFN
jgi:hypothetical protein